MDKIKFDIIKDDIVSIVSKNEKSIVYKLKNGEYLKIITPKFLSVLNVGNLNFEQKLLDASKYVRTNNISKPNTIVYSKSGICVGYKMKPSFGKSLNDEKLDLNLKTDLERYKIIHKSLEQIVKKEKDIIFPDLCTCDNIFLSKKLKLFLIDYDGMQIGPNSSVIISTTIGYDCDYANNKKYYNNCLFNKNLDKKSLAYLFFLDVFNTKLSSVGITVPETNTKINLGNIFEYIGFRDYKLYDKLSKLYDDTQDNDYLDDDIDRIARDYKLILMPAFTPEGYVKRLIKK